MTLGTGEKVVIFKPLEPYETPAAIDAICEKYQEALDKEVVDELILIPCFLLDFLCIHPFNDGNGRMSRLLTLLLLYRSGYMVGQYVSIEKAIADSKDAYYEALQKSDQGWHEGTNDPKPFIKYMLSIILSCYREFESRITIAYAAGAKSTSYDIVKAYDKLLMILTAVIFVLGFVSWFLFLWLDGVDVFFLTFIPPVSKIIGMIAVMAACVKN